MDRRATAAFLQMLRISGFLVVAFVAVLSQCPPAPAADDDLTPAQKDAVLKACVATGNTCISACKSKYPFRDKSVGQNIGYGFCRDDCRATYNQCRDSVAARGAAGGPPATGGVLDPGAGDTGGTGGATTGGFGTRLQKGGTASPSP